MILDDAALRFRASPGSWPAVLRCRDGAASPDTAHRPWVLVKMTSPAASGELWRRLLRLHARRLIAVMTLDDLRLSDMKISRELSWERIAGDLARGLVRQPTVNGLLDCAHVVVSLGTGGAVLLSRPRTLDGRLDWLGTPHCQVFFDPESIENSWAEQYPGSMIGYTTCLVAGIARAVVLDPGQPDLGRGIRSGLAAAPALHLQGYGAAAPEPGRAGLAFPAADMAAELARGPRTFARAKVEQPVRDSWSILQGRYPEGLGPVAEAVALEGVEAAAIRPNCGSASPATGCWPSQTASKPGSRPPWPASKPTTPDGRSWLSPRSPRARIGLWQTLSSSDPARGWRQSCRCRNSTSSTTSPALHQRRSSCACSPAPTRSPNCPPAPPARTPMPPPTTACWAKSTSWDGQGGQGEGEPPRSSPKPANTVCHSPGSMPATALRAP